MVKKNSPFEYLFNIVRRLPWWMGFLLAIGSYMYFYSVALEAQLPGSGSDGVAVTGLLAKGVAMALQYILPLVFSLAGLASFVDKRRRRRDYDQIAPGGMRAVADISWKEFERVVGEAFRRKGYAVTETADGAGGGMDVYASPDGLGL